MNHKKKEATMNASPQERRAEIVAFKAENPAAENAQIVDHMTQKYPHLGRHIFRADLQRLPKVPLTPPKAQVALNLDAVKTGRTSSKAPNPGAKPTFKSAKSLPPQKGRRKLEHVDIHPEETQRRVEFVLECFNPRATEKSLLRKVKKEFPQPNEAATLAIIVQVFKSKGDHEDFPARMTRMYGERKCPTCGEKAFGVDDVFKVFGFRPDAGVKNARSQSYCRGCRTKKKVAS
jgi:hypothetical protein